MAPSHNYHGSEMMEREESNQHIKIYLKKGMPRHSICSASLRADIKLALKTAWLSNSARCSPPLHWSRIWKILHFSKLLMAGMYSPLRGLAYSWAFTNFLFFLHVLETERRALEPASPLSVVYWSWRKPFSSSTHPCKASMWKRCCYCMRRRLLYKEMLQRCSAPTINCKRRIYFYFSDSEAF